MGASVVMSVHQKTIPAISNRNVRKKADSLLALPLNDIMVE